MDNPVNAGEESVFPLSCSSKRTIPFSSMGFCYLRPLGSGTGERQQLICLRSDRLYTVGRKRRHCQIVFDYCCISRRHCQIFFDGDDRKLRLVDGFPFFRASRLGEVRRSFRSERERLGFKVSLNGVFVNGRRLQRGTIVELSEGDEVSFGCGRRRSGPCCKMRRGFVVKSIVFSGFAGIPDVSERSIARADLLLNLCRRVLRTGNPIKYLHRSLQFNFVQQSRLNAVEHHGLVASFRVLGSENCSRMAAKAATCTNKVISSMKIAEGISTNVELETCSPKSVYFKKSGYHPHSEKETNLDFYTDGKAFFLNRLEYMDLVTSYQHTEVTLKELLHPVESLKQVFIATFTCDVSWFLQCCQIPNHLPVTIACHSTEKCWSSNCNDRSWVPYSNYPNLLLVYPPFPDEIAFGKDRNKKGVACHHPKMFVLQREESVRVIITSANLVSKQWNQITNTVWWQDFPRRYAPDYTSFFGINEDSKSDFAAQLAGFIASLVAGVPSQAQWIKELAKYNFSRATAHLIASRPGMHSPNNNYFGTDCFVTFKQVLYSKPTTAKYLGFVQASVVGLSHRFNNTTKSSGTELKKLSSCLGKFQESSTGLLEVILRRDHNIPADANAISILVAIVDEQADGDCIQLGFLTRDVAKWVAPLFDHSFLELSAFIHPKEALAAVLDGKHTKIQCFLCATEGPNFSNISGLILPEHLSAFCSFIASIQRCLGVCRLQEVISRYKWPESLETDFVYASSSIGTSVNPEFLAAFSAAAGKKSFQLSESEESDPEWGCWSTYHELRQPSIRILFPTLERVKASVHGIHSSKCLLSLSEKTWQRMRPSGILHDAIPNPAYRIGYPMHVKVARRRFLSKSGNSAFGWIYCGSHNFSPAAWGRIVLPSGKGGSGAFARMVSGAKLHICNYELGIILIIPPPDMTGHIETTSNLDDITLPFLMPAPRYSFSDRPATHGAMREAIAECSISKQVAFIELEEEEMDEDVSDEEVGSSDYVAEENEDDKIYAEMLWSQVDSSESF